MLNQTLLALLAAILLSSPYTRMARADDAEDLNVLRETTSSLLDLMVEQGLLTRQKADALVREAQKRAAARAKAAPPAATAKKSAPVEDDVMRVPLIPEIVQRDMEEKIKQQVLAQAKTERWGDPGALPAWLDRITWEGDLRLRYQLDRFPDDTVPNAPPAVFALNGQPIENTSETRNRLRVRFRFGMQAAISDKTTVGLRLASGTPGQGGEIAGNQTLGVYNSRFVVGIDRAFLQYKPNETWAFLGGRIANPFYTSSNLVWHDSISLDGLVAKYTRSAERTGAFATAGIFPIQDVAPSPTNSANSKWMLGYQAGLLARLSPVNQLTVGLGYYDFHNMEGIPNPTLVSTEFDSTAPQFRQKGNSVFDINAIKNLGNPNPSYLWGLASKFQVLNLAASLDLGAFDPIHVIIDADYVKNLGFDRQEILSRTGLDIAPRTTGYQARLTVGHPRLRNAGQWQTYIGYRYLQRDATLDSFTDSEFHLGGTDARGYTLGGVVAFDKNTQIGLRWMSSKQIDGLPLAIDILQADVTTSF